MRQIDIGLEELIVFEPDNNSSNYKATPKNKMKRCPHCNSEDIKLFGTTTRCVKDIIHNKKISESKPILLNKKDLEFKPIEIVVTIQRYSCKNEKCKKNFSDRFLFVREDYDYSNRFIEFIQKLAYNNSFQSIVNAFKEKGFTISREFIKSHFDEAVEIRDKSRIFKAPSILNICLIKFNRDEAAEASVLSDAFNNTILELSEHTDRENIRALLKKLSNREMTQLIITSVLVPNKAIQAAFPKTPIIISPSYAIRAAAYILKIVQSEYKLRYPDRWRSLAKPCKQMLCRNDNPSDEVTLTRNKVFLQYPELKDAYDLYFGFKQVYNKKTYKEAESALESWIRNAEVWFKRIKQWLQFSGSISEISSIIKSISSWKKEIIYYIRLESQSSKFDTHSLILDDLIKTLINNGSNCSIKTIRGKIIYGLESDCSVKTYTSELDIDCGIRKIDDISTLTKSVGIGILELTKYLDENKDFLE